MQFHSTGTDPTTSALLVCRSVRWNVALLLAVLWAAPVVWWWVAAPWWITSFCAALPVLLTWPMVGSWRNRGRADNWVLALDAQGLWLNLRDCEYHEAEPGQTIVFLPFREVAAARPVGHRFTTPSGNGSTIQHHTKYLELRTSSTNIDLLRQALRDESRRALPQRSRLGGTVTTRTNRTHSAIAVDGPNAVRVTFSSSISRLRPALKAALAVLNTFVAVEPSEELQTANWRDVDGPAFNELVRQLVVGGQRIHALELLRRRRGLSGAEAMRLVDQLSEQPSASA